MSAPIRVKSSRRDRNAAFEMEALPWIDDVHRFALSLTRDEADADDVVQDTLLRAYRSWHTYMPGSDCRRWLFTICRNVFLRSRERTRETVELDPNDADGLAATEPQLSLIQGGSDDTLSRLDLGPAILAALARVPEPFRSVLVIVDVEDQPYETAAVTLGVPIGTVRSRLFRGRRLMQEQLLAFARDAGYATAKPLSRVFAPVATAQLRAALNRASVRRGEPSDRARATPELVPNRLIRSAVQHENRVRLDIAGERR